MSLERILVATDLSERSDRAMERAVLLARVTGARLIVLHVVDADLPGAAAEQMRAQAARQIGEFLAARADGVPCEIDLRTDDPVHGMLEAQAQHRPGLFVMGSHRPRGFLVEIREHTAERVVRHAPCSVLVVRGQAVTSYEAAIVAVDFSPASGAALRMAGTVAPDARVQSVHAVHVPYAGLMAASGETDTVSASFLKAAREEAAAWSAAQPAGARAAAVEVVAGSPSGVVAEKAAAMGADLIAAGAHGRVGASPALLGSFANHLMREAPCDVLIARV